MLEYNRIEYRDQIEKSLHNKSVLRLNLYNEEELYMNNKAICTIRANAFKNFNKITNLTLDLNNLTKLEASPFMELSQLKELNLTFETKKTINSENNLFRGLISLEKLHLDIKYPNFEFNGSEISEDLKCLKSLHIKGISFDSISDNYFIKAQELESIMLSHNKINSNGIFGIRDLNKLQNIRIDFNPIETLNLQSFANLPQLGKVRLSWNNIQRIKYTKDDEIQQDRNAFPVLKTLNISYNQITQVVYGTFIQLNHLIHLDLSFNSLTNIEKNTFNGLYQLCTLELSNNIIETIEPGSFDSSPLLKKLDLSRNNLIILDSSLFCELTHLETLNIEGNKLPKNCIDLLSLLYNKIQNNCQLSKKIRLE